MNIRFSCMYLGPPCNGNEESCCTKDEPCGEGEGRIIIFLGGIKEN